MISKQTGGKEISRAFDVSTEEQERLMQRFAQAAATGDMQELLALLAEDVTLWADGGGKVVAALRPVRGRAKVACFIIGALRKLVPAEKVSRLLEVNGQLANPVRIHIQ